MFKFKRGISTDFVKRLNDEYNNGGWWRSIADDRKLFIAIRDGYLNVYWKGNSLLRLTLDEKKRLVGETHYKYLLRSELVDNKQYILSYNGKVESFDASKMFLPDLSSIAALTRAADAYSGDEKAGVHQIILSNPNIIDVEVTFGLEGDNEKSPATRRIDFAALRPTADGAEIVFYEAKLFSNKEIRAKGNAIPPVVGQIKDYQELLITHTKDVEHSYRTICGNLAALDGVRGRYNADLLASGNAALHVSKNVWLVVFGFDIDQRDGKVWSKHKKKLEETALKDRLLFNGNPKEITRGIPSTL
ncbi:MAG: hypothetical protein A3G18_06255 [Rhodospirillales bacterium RIFCSPLOWO2_12_FULL_58_28]|nr:MAG: hypothetical protein A3H92_12530 [Rhodospirillales bacterium RIFCSPLOWO2_02_FULL_58_16]OHC76786.1 MAG: hypothetical protein A3G18_06255 [Rhodospirillales bacterium RIFCSPLOWO2_12_FULL_58_28]